MRVIDGMHRLMAASLKGQETVDVEYFDGSSADAFLLAVEANVTHGLPLSQADRRAAATRIVASHPHLSDRAIAHSVGLAARTVAGVRRRSTGAAPQLNARVGRDGKVRPLNAAAGRRRAAELIADRPDASLREVARGAGVSLGTARDVRKRLERGEEPAPTQPRTDDTCGGATAIGQPTRSRIRLASGPAPASLLEKLMRDPSLRHTDQGRRLLRWLQHSAVDTQDWSSLVAAVPPHCAALVVQLANRYAQTLLAFAEELDERARVTDPWDRPPVTSRS